MSEMKSMVELIWHAEDLDLEARRMITAAYKLGAADMRDRLVQHFPDAAIVAHEIPLIAEEE